MSFEKTWSFLANQAPIDSTSAVTIEKSFMLQLKNFLVSIGWTVSQSCDKTTVSSSDILGSTIANVTKGSEGQAHSWWVCKSPVGIVAGSDGSYTGDQSRIWLVFSANSASGGSGTIAFHRVAPTGGSTTATPTSTDVMTVCNLGVFIYNSLASMTFNFGGTSTGNFYAFASVNSSSKASTILAALPLGSVNQILATSKDYPYGVAFYFGYASSTGGPLMSDCLPANKVYGWNADGTSGTNQFRIMSIGNGTNGWIGINMGSGGDSINSKQIYAPLWLQNENTNKTAYIGRIADVFGAAGSTPQMSVDSNSSPTYQYIGNFWWPVNTVLSM